MIIAVALALACTTLVPVSAQASTGDLQLDRRLIRLEAETAAQAEARARQADAFNAAATRMEFVNGALVAVIALAGIGGSLLAIRWVRSLAHDQVEAQIDSAIRETGESIFERDAKDLRNEYEEKFTRLYREFQETFENQ